MTSRRPPPRTRFRRRTPTDARERSWTRRSRRRTTPTAVSETQRSVGRVAPDAPHTQDVLDSRPAEEDAPGTGTAETETTTDDVDDWLADD